jgi:hypothetical protein
VSVIVANVQLGVDFLMSKTMIKLASGLILGVGILTIGVQSAMAEIVCSVCVTDTSTGRTICQRVVCPPE